jgi:hypothetical protein
VEGVARRIELLLPVIYGRPVTSSETWTWLRSPVFRATPLDMKAEADRHF